MCWEMGNRTGYNYSKYSSSLKRVHESNTGNGRRVGIAPGESCCDPSGDDHYAGNGTKYELPDRRHGRSRGRRSGSR